MHTNTDEITVQTLWDAVRYCLSASEKPMTLVQLSRTVPKTGYTGSTTPVSIRRVLRRKALFGKVVEPSPGEYQLA